MSTSPDDESRRPQGTATRMEGTIIPLLRGNWTGRIEYLYMDLGRFNSTVALAPPPTIGANISSRVTDHILRVGINYHFHHGPVVARY